MNALNKIMMWSICLVIPGLVAGSFISDSLVVIVAILFLINTYIKKQYFYYREKFFIIFFIFWCILIISSLSNPEENFYSLQTSITYIRFGLFVMGILYIVDHEKNFGKYFFAVLLITYSVLIFDGIFQYFNGTNIIGLKHPHPDRLTSFFDRNLKLGSFLARTLPLLIAFLIIKKNYSGWNILASTILLALTDILIFLAMERAAFYLSILATVYIIIFISSKKIIRIASFILAIGVITVITNTNELVGGRMIDQTIKSIKNTIDKGEPFTPSHSSLYKTSFALFQDNYIIGIGPKMFRKKCNDVSIKNSRCSTHPHNTYVQILTETGIVGFSFLLGLLFYFIKTSFYQFFFKRNKEVGMNDFGVCCMAAVAITLWPFIPHGNFFNNWISVIYYLPAAFILRQKKIVKNLK